MGNPLDIGACLNAGWKTFSREAVALIVGCLLMSLVSSVSLGLLSGPMMIGFASMCIRAARGEKIEIGDVFSGFSQFGPAFLLMIITGIGICIGTMLCIIPGLVLAVLWAWAPFIMAARQDDPMTCLRDSMEFAKHNIGPHLIFLIVAGLVMSVGSVVAIGSLVTVPIGYAMIAHGYLNAFEGGGRVAEQPLAPQI